VLITVGSELDEALVAHYEADHMDQSAPNKDEIVVDLNESAMPLDGGIKKSMTLEIPEGAEYNISSKIA
jgi:hypothetical protein